MEWQPIDTAPKDGTLILGWCVHAADPYWLDKKKNIITLYAAHTDCLSHVADGPHVIVWGGDFDDRSYDDPHAGYLDPWWFQYGSDFEITANPTHWIPIPVFTVEGA